MSSSMDEQNNLLCSIQPAEERKEVEEVAYMIT
jgi:hypothetical protein